MHRVGGYVGLVFGFEVFEMSTCRVLSFRVFEVPHEVTSRPTLIKHTKFDRERSSSGSPRHEKIAGVRRIRDGIQNPRIPCPVSAKNNQCPVRPRCLFLVRMCDQQLGRNATPWQS